MPDAYATNSIGLDSGAIKSSYDGSAWTPVREIIQYTAKLIKGTSATVILELRDSRLLTVTAVTLVFDTQTDILTNAILSRGYEDYRFRQTAGTGVALINA